VKRKWRGGGKGHSVGWGSKDTQNGAHRAGDRRVHYIKGKDYGRPLATVGVCPARWELPGGNTRHDHPKSTGAPAAVHRSL